MALWEVTGEIRWLINPDVMVAVGVSRGTVSSSIQRKLQMERRCLETGETRWEDVPEVEGEEQDFR